MWQKLGHREHGLLDPWERLWIFTPRSLDSGPAPRILGLPDRVPDYRGTPDFRIPGGADSRIHRGADSSGGAKDWLRVHSMHVERA